jgi:hypothetical protein
LPSGGDPVSFAFCLLAIHPKQDTGVGSAAVFVAADCVGLPKCLLI